MAIVLVLGEKPFSPEQLVRIIDSRMKAKEAAMYEATFAAKYNH